MTAYYMTCAIPKPQTVRKKKKYNGYKDKKNRICAYCGEPYAERHEVFWGPLRGISIEFGFQVDACGRHHKELHENYTDWAKSENLYLRRYYERKYLDEKIDEGMSEKEALRDWMNLMGKNYLEECDPE